MPFFAHCLYVGFGQGLLTTPDGQTCEGEFVLGNPHGKVNKRPRKMKKGKRRNERSELDESEDDGIIKRNEGEQERREYLRVMLCVFLCFVFLFLF